MKSIKDNDRKEINMKKFLSLFLAGIILISSASAVAFAEEIDVQSESKMESIEIAEPGEDEYYLISEKTTILEDGSVLTDRLYSTVNPMERAASGEGWFRNDKEIDFVNDSGKTLNYWVKGYFKWNSKDNEVTVSNPESGYDKKTLAEFSKCEIFGETTTAKSNQGFNFLAGRKYAYVEYKFTFKNSIGSERNFSAYVDVNIDGVSSTK